MLQPVINIIIPNFNGKRLIGNCLAKILPEEVQTIVIDDASSDGSAEWIAKNYPDVKLISLDKNSGFSVAVNEGIKAAKSDLVVLLNNDVEVTEGFLDSIIPLFEDERLFAVSPRIILPNYGGINEGLKTGHWHHGLFYTDQRQDEIDNTVPVLYATGCAAVYRRSMLVELGGFDEAYSPFYWEDVDLCYRAWKRNWHTLYQPKSTVYHQHSASISRLNASYTNKIKARNSLFFIWRNIEDRTLISTHKRWLPLILIKKIMQRNWAFIAGWREAYSRRHEALCALKRESKMRKLSDLEIFQNVGIQIR